MKKLHQLRSEQAGRFSGVTNLILALLLAVGLVQIALCFHAASGLVPVGGEIVSSEAGPAYVTNAPVAHDISASKNEKS